MPRALLRDLMAVFILASTAAAPQTYHTISDVAARCLCSSASPASSERLLPKEGLRMTKERMRLAGECIALILSVRTTNTSIRGRESNSVVAVLAFTL